MSQLRATILAQQEKIASRQRFGLFSQPPPLALGDDSLFKTLQHPRGQDGKPITVPRNLLSGTNRSGVGKKGYFAVPDSIYQGDQYQDQYRLQMTYDKKMHSKSTFHENDFKPASGSKTLAKSSYQYKQQKPITQKKRKLTEDGRVWTAPKNITSNPMSKVESQFMKNPQYVDDPIDRKKLIQIKQKQIWRSKLPDASWKFAKSSNGTFTRDKLSYGLDEQAHRVLAQKKQPRKIHFKTVAHESSFVPAIKITNQPIGKYPKAMSAQSMQTLRPKPQTKTDKDKDGWRPSGISRTKPSPSISLNKKNIHIGRYR